MKLGVVGATGLVGQVILDVLAERGTRVDDFRAFASARGAGQRVVLGGRVQVVENAARADFAGLDLVLMSAGADAARALAPRAVEAGAIVVDNSSAFRADPDVPLVVSEVNPGALASIPRGIVANPNCTTMVAMTAVGPLHAAAGLRRLVVSSYQAVSGAGRDGVDELCGQVR
ncbi:MAG: aspartate-semialdehyde dehydrogenase, partial [Planctomycetota bacterium]